RTASGCATTGWTMSAWWLRWLRKQLLPPPGGPDPSRGEYFPDFARIGGAFPLKFKSFPVTSRRGARSDGARISGG
ncbi:MAG: hypothetical protein ACR2HE_13015, partial [Casimicrobiaceae bacterium]